MYLGNSSALTDTRVPDSATTLRPPWYSDPLVWLAIAGALYIVFVTPTTVRLLRG